MKIEVGKKYVDERGVVVDVVGALDGIFYVKEKSLMICKPYYEDGSSLITGYDLVKEYTEIKTQDAWVVWNSRGGLTVVNSLEEFGCDIAYFSPKAVKKVTLTEGEFDND